MGSADQRKK